LLAVQHRWGKAKLDQMAFALGYFERIPIVADRLIEIYARLDSSMAGRGRFLGKNDLWIAATAAVTGATLLTIDGDFDPLDPQFLTRIRVAVPPPNTDPPPPRSPPP